MKKQTKIFFKTIFIVILLTFSISVLNLRHTNHYSDKEKNYNTINLKKNDISDKIYINYDNWSNLEGISGSGSLFDPWVIQDLYIDGYSSGSCIRIENSYEHFRIENCTLANSGLFTDAGIKMHYVANGTIYNNTFLNTPVGVHLVPEAWLPPIGDSNMTILDNTFYDNSYSSIIIDQAKNCTISQNRIINNNYESYSSEISVNLCEKINLVGNEISSSIGYIYIFWAFQTKDITISNNNMNGCGIFIDKTHEDATVADLSSLSIDQTNTVNGKTLYYYVHQNDLTSPDFSDAGQIILADCNYSHISDIEINNTPVGLALYDCESNNITNMILEDNIYGLYLHGSSKNKITENIFSNNHNHGIKLIKKSENNTIYLNELIDNEVNAQDDGNINEWDNSLIGNFWSDYTGTDYDFDGIGDIPYEILGTANALDHFPVVKDFYNRISILSPKMNQEFSDLPPSFEIELLEPNLDTTWYTIDQGINNITFSRTTETIDPSFWYNAPDGSISLKVFVNDTLGNIEYDEVIIQKFTQRTVKIPNYRISSKEMITNQGFIEPCVYVESDNLGNVHLLWVENTKIDGDNDRDILYQFWNTSLGIWSEIELISEVSENFTFIPTIEIDISGNLHVAWSDTTPLDGDPDPDVFYKFWDSNTNEWSDIEIITDTHNELCEGFIELEVEPSGAVHAIWDEGYNPAHPGTVEIYYAFRNPSSGIWSSEVALSSGYDKFSIWGDIILDKSNNLHAFWSDEEDINGAGSDFDIFHRVRRKIDGSWSDIDVITKKSNKDCDDPQVEMDINGRMSLYWKEDGLYGNNYIFQVQSDLEYQCWSNGEIISTSGSMAKDQLGNIHLAWSETNFDDTEEGRDIYYKFFNSSANTWTEPKIVSSESNLNCHNPMLSIDKFGMVHIFWHEENQFSGSESTLYYRKIIHDTKSPDIKIENPRNNQEFGTLAPVFDITVEDPYLHSIWYTVDGGLTNKTIENLIGKIDQDLWNHLPDGYVSIDFYAKDYLGNIGATRVIVIKDIPEQPIVFEEFKLNIGAPKMNQEFGAFTPGYEIFIEGGTYSRVWYTIDGGSTNFTINNLIGAIDQSAWDAMPNGQVNFSVFVNDSSNKIYHDEVIIYKNPQIEVYLHAQSYSQTEFLVTFFICNTDEQAITFATFQVWWNETDITENIRNIGRGFYEVSLDPIFIDSEEESVWLECIISAEGYTDKYYETQINLNSTKLKSQSGGISMILATVITISSIAGGLGVASILIYTLRKKRLKVS